MRILIVLHRYSDIERKERQRAEKSRCHRNVSQIRSTRQDQSSHPEMASCWDLRNDSQLMRSPRHGFVVKIASAVDYIIEIRSAFMACPTVPHRVNRLLFNVGRVTGEASRHVPLPLRWKLKSFERISQRASVCVYFHKTTARTEARRLRIGEFVREFPGGANMRQAALRTLSCSTWCLASLCVIRTSSSDTCCRVNTPRASYVRTYICTRARSPGYRCYRIFSLDFCDRLFLEEIKRIRSAITRWLSQFSLRETISLTLSEPRGRSRAQRNPLFL